MNEQVEEKQEEEEEGKDLHRQKKWLRRKMNRMKKEILYICVGKKCEKEECYAFSRRDKRVPENLSCKYSVTELDECWILNMNIVCQKNSHITDLFIFYLLPFGCSFSRFVLSIRI